MRQFVLWLLWLLPERAHTIVAHATGWKVAKVWKPDAQGEPIAETIHYRVIKDRQ